MNSALLIFFAVLAALCALLVLTLRQPMRAALALVGLMLNLAAIYACLGAHVVAVFQVLIYVGAVMVFMVYTIMLLNDRDNSYREPFTRLALPAVAVTGVILVGFWKLLQRWPEVRAAAPANDIFSFGAFSQAFMQRYWFHFELATVLLLVGILVSWTVLKEGRNG